MSNWLKGSVGISITVKKLCIYLPQKVVDTDVFALSLFCFIIIFYYFKCVLKFQDLSDVTTSDCGTGVNCYKEPSTCTASNNCNILVKSKYENDKVHVVMSTNQTLGYSGWAQTKTYESKKMVSILYQYILLYLAIILILE